MADKSPVVATEEDNWAAESCGKVEAAVKVPFARCPLPKIAHNARGFALELHRVCCACSLGDLGRKGRRYRVEVEGLAAIVDGHHSALVARFCIANALVAHLLQRISPPKEDSRLTILCQKKRQESAAFSGAAWHACMASTSSSTTSASNEGKRACLGEFCRWLRKT